MGMPVTTGPLERARKMLLECEGFDLGRYKADCAQPRLARAVVRSGADTYEAFFARAVTDPAARRLLIESLSVSHSEFFRNPPLFERLVATVIPRLLAGRAGRPIKILSAGCGRGEEPYSLALILREHFPSHWAAGRFLLRGLDLDAGAIARAREGRYDASRLESVPRPLRERYFRSLGEGLFGLDPLIRDRVEFAAQDLFGLHADRPSEDLILVRNLCIYLTRGAQGCLLGLLERHLRPGGYLVLGKTESLPPKLRASFEPVDLRERVYRKPPAAECRASVAVTS